MPYEALKPVPFGGLDDHDALTIEETKSPNLRNVRGDRTRIELGPGAALFAEAPVPSSTVGAGVVQASFEKKVDGTGTQEVAHTLGVTPVGAIFFAVNADTNTDASQAAMACYGITDGTDDYCITSYETNSGATTTARRHADGSALAFINSSGTVVARAALSAWDADSFTLNWTTNDTNLYRIYVLLFGTSTMNGKVVATQVTATGNLSNTGSAFTPVFAFHLHALLGQPSQGSGTGSTHIRNGVGVMSATEQACHSYAVGHGLVTTQTQAERDISRCLDAVRYTGTGEDFTATFVSFNANGFTINVGTYPGSSFYIYTLLLDDIDDISIHNLTRDTSGAAPFTQSVTTPGFEPDGLLFFSNADNDGNGPGAQTMFGCATSGQLGHVVYANSQAGLSASTAHTRVMSYASRMAVGRYSSAINQDFRGSLSSLDATGYTVTWEANNDTTDADRIIATAFGFDASIASEIGTIRNYAQVYTGATGTEKLLIMTSNGIGVWNTSTSVFDWSAESYTITAGRRYYVANTQDAAVWAVDATSSAPNLRHYDGSSYADLITSGTNHKARFCIAFNDRIISGYTYHTAAVHPTQLRWCRSGNIRNWDTSTGSAGTLEVIETSNAPITGMFVMGERAYVTKEREIVELIPTGSLSPVHRQATRVFGTGCIAPYSFGHGEFFTFMLGPDNVYLFDGSQLRPIGEPVRRTIAALIDYTNKDDVQGVYLQATQEYWLRIGNDVFIYDLHDDRWFRDSYTDQTAIGIVRVGGIITTDVDHSEFLVLGSSSGSTLRVSENLTTILGGEIDAYVETKDFYAIRPVRGSDGDKDRATSTIRAKNMMTSIAVHTDASAVIEIGVSTDRGTTWDTEDVTANADGIAQRWVIKPYQQIRFRFRTTTSGDFRIYGAYSYRWDTAGMTLGP